MQDLTRFALAANLKWLLVAGLALTAVAMLYGSWHGATVLLQNPTAPGEVELLNRFGRWLPVLVRLLVAAALLGLMHWLRGAGWGQDLSWSNGAWVPTEHFGTMAGAQSDPALAIGEPGTSRIVPLVWTALLAMALAGAYWQLPPTPPFYAPLVFLVLGTLCALAAITALEARTRSLGFDDNGLCDATVLGARRVPWSAVSRVSRRNTNEAAQQRYDRASKRSGSRPPNDWAQELLDAEGRVILSFGDNLVPRPHFEQLLARAARIDPIDYDGARGGSTRIARDTQDLADVEANAEEDEDPQLTAEFARMAAESAARSAQHDRIMRRGWMLLTSPFLLFTLWLAWKAAYLRFAAERVEGTVVAVEGGELRMLGVEYRDASGATHRIDSDGSRANLRYDTGDAIRVFYRAEAPDEARLDLFLELWLGALISAGITALVAIPLLFMR